MISSPQNISDCMETLILEKKNEVYLTVNADASVERELSEFFTFYVPGYKFMPAFRTVSYTHLTLPTKRIV